jgi:hypothetical protein
LLAPVNGVAFGLLCGRWRPRAASGREGRRGRGRGRGRRSRSGRRVGKVVGRRRRDAKDTLEVSHAVGVAKCVLLEFYGAVQPVGSMRHLEVPSIRRGKA